MPRTSIRHQYSAGRSENYLASVSDLMSALLFVFIIALACAIIQAQSAANEAEAAQTRAEDAQTRAEEAQAQATTAHAQAEQVRERLVEVEKRLQGNNVARAGLLMHIKERLAADLGIQVSIDTSKGVLRLAEEAVTFRKQSYALESPYLERVSEMGKYFAKILPCYRPAGLDNPAGAAPLCKTINPNGNLLDAVFIEGHTDNLRFRGDSSNWRNRMLSASRANSVFEVMVLGNAELAEMTNSAGESLFSLSGYGSDRPLPNHDHDEPTDDQANRRIEFRFIFEEPRIRDEEVRMIASPGLKSNASSSNSAIGAHPNEGL